MFGSVKVTTNAGGVPYLKTNNVTVSAESVDFSLGIRSIPPIGYLTVNIADVIPTGTTATLPVRFVLNGSARNVTVFGGDNVTVADIPGTGVVTVFYDWYSGILQLTSPTTV